MGCGRIPEGMYLLVGVKGGLCSPVPPNRRLRGPVFARRHFFIALGRLEPGPEEGVFARMPALIVVFARTCGLCRSKPHPCRQATGQGVVSLAERGLLA
jgi:hypothetical protein